MISYKLTCYFFPSSLQFPFVVCNRIKNEVLWRESSRMSPSAESGLIALLEYVKTRIPNELAGISPLWRIFQSVNYPFAYNTTHKMLQTITNAKLTEVVAVQHGHYGHSSIILVVRAYALMQQSVLLLARYWLKS